MTKVAYSFPLRIQPALPLRLSLTLYTLSYKLKLLYSVQYFLIIYIYIFFFNDLTMS